MQIYELSGTPIPWMRAGRNGNRYYDKQISEKTNVQWNIKSSLKGHKCHTEPIKVTLEFHMPIPKSWPKIRQQNAFYKPHHSRPDVDNLIKFVNDSLNGVLWKDDSLIYEIHVRKFYSKEPKTRIYVEPYTDERFTTLFPRVVYRQGDA